MARTASAGTASLSVQMKIGILDTIANSIYSDPKVKIREAVANSMDNHATWFVIYADRPSMTLTLIDNGAGITRTRFDEIFQNIGYGTERGNIYSNSYFGLGLLSILAFGKSARVVSKSRKEGEVIKLEIDSDRIFSEEMRDKPIADVAKLITIKTSDLAERERISILDNNAIKKLAGDFPSSFTEIILQGIDAGVFNQVTSEDFGTELRKTLPLQVHENEPFLKSIKDPAALKWLTETMGNRKFCPTIDIYFGISEGERELARLWKYFPDFKKDLKVGAADIVYGESREKFKGHGAMFRYYYLYSTDDLEERTKVNTETGFWVRNKNFLIKEADYFQKPGSKKKIIHEPLKNWLFGEVFHRDMTDFLIVTRNEYVWESPRFQSFYEEIRDLVGELNKALRDVWRNSREVIQSVVNPFIEVKEVSNPFTRTYDTLSTIGILKKVQDAESILQKLSERRKPELEKEDFRIDRIMARSAEDIVLAEDKNMRVLIDRKVEPEVQFVKQREGKTNRLVVRISPAIFSPQETVFLGRTFEVNYVVGDESAPGISIDNEKRKIYVNPFNQDVLRYSVSFIEIYIATEVADIYSETKSEMKCLLLQLLGAKLTPAELNPKKYLFSLKDELQRRQRSD
jgi:hypothetical protein